MASGRKRSEGCWTCRLRRKRCNLIRPVCGSCSSLQITCHFDHQKPAWMDGAIKQKEMMQTITTEIKQNALRRRERRNLGSQEREITVTIEEQNQNGFTEANKSPGMQIHVEQQLSPATPHFSCPINSSPKNAGALLSSDKGVELGFVMIYLDYVFPFLFPFYHPPLLETGRHWLLSLLCLNEVSFHTAASLSSYFFSLAAQNGQRELEEQCKALIWEKVLEQTDFALKKIQQDVFDVSHLGVQNALVQSAYVLGEIIELLIVEVTVRETVDWTIHLFPALALLEEIFKFHGASSSQPNLNAVLKQMPPPLMATEMAHSKPLPNTAEQSAFLFHIAILVVVDIIFSTALDQPPRLQQYHPSLLSNLHSNEPPVQLEAFVGCQNWVLLAIGDISALTIWKKNNKTAGRWSAVELVDRAKPISEALENGLRNLNSSQTKNHTEKTAGDRLQSYHARLEGKPIDYNSIVTSTRIWAHAAIIYLSITLSGWQPAHPNVQESVMAILKLLQSIESPAQLRSLSWPLCVAGCLALPHQEQEFRTHFENMGELKVFGTLGQAQKIMEEVWKLRDTLDPSTWDISSCLNILGTSALWI